MGANTAIQWCDHTFNPWWGCEKVSPGCEHCYAETMAKRTGFVQWGHGRDRRRTSASNWHQPVKWQEAAYRDGTRPRVFCASMADWLDDAVPAEWVADLFDLIYDTPELDWLLLTKRPQAFGNRIRQVINVAHDSLSLSLVRWLDGHPPDNVWIGATVEDQRRADERIPRLVDIPAHVRFLSCEPMLERIDLTIAAFNGADSFGTLPGIHWVIVGGESGTGARPFSVLWAKDVIEQCRRAGTRAFVKQLGRRPIVTGELLTDFPRAEYETTDDRWIAMLADSHGGDWNEWPADLRVRLFPAICDRR